MAMAIGLYQSCMVSWPVWRLTTDSKQRVPNGDMARMAAVPFLFSGGVLVARVQEGKPGSDDSAGFWKTHAVSLRKENIDLRTIEEREILQN